MRTKLLILLALLLTFAACKKVQTDEQPYNNELILGAVSQETDTKSATSSPLRQGYQFRLYILPQDETDPTKAIMTRTYTIVDGAGKPEMDAGQEPIKLGLASYDNYIVGPLNGVDKDGAAVEIAAPNTVNAHVGNDIVSSYTRLKMNHGDNVLNANPLAHKMAKADFFIERGTGASYTELEVLTVSFDNQPVSGVFTFDSGGGSITANSDVATRVLYPVDASASEAESKSKYVAIDYLFSQPSKKFKIETSFNATNLGVQKKYSQSGFVTTDVVAGNQYQFTANPYLAIDILWRLTLVPWDDVVVGDVSAHDKELVFSYSGLDAPITIDGVKYWKDRSGNGNHAKMDGNIYHNAAGKFYSSTNNNGSLVLPKLGQMEDVTVEIVCRSVRGVNTTLFSEHGEFKIHIPYNTNLVYLDWGSITDSRINYSYNGSFDRLATWQFTRKVNESNIRSEIIRNGVFQHGGDIVSRTMTLDNVLMLSTNSHVIKLYSARMYRRVLSSAELVQNSKSDFNTYGQSVIGDLGPAGDILGMAKDYWTHVVTKSAWSVACSAGITASPSSGTGGEVVKLSVSANGSTTASRNLTATFTSGADVDQWSATQAMKSDIMVAPAVAVDNPIPNTGKAYTLNVTTNYAWDVASTAGDLTFSPAVGNSTSVTVPTNPTAASRAVSARFFTTTNEDVAQATWSATQAGSTLAVAASVDMVASTARTARIGITGTTGLRIAVTKKSGDAAFNSISSPSFTCNGKLQVVTINISSDNPSLTTAREAVYDFKVTNAGNDGSLNKTVTVKQDSANPLRVAGYITVADDGTGLPAGMMCMGMYGDHNGTAYTKALYIDKKGNSLMGVNSGDTDEIQLTWGPTNVLIGATDEYQGLANTDKAVALGTQYAAANYCKNKGMYLPTALQFADSFKANLGLFVGDHVLLVTSRYVCSDERDIDNAVYLGLNRDSTTIYSMQKNTSRYVRCVAEF